MGVYTTPFNFTPAASPLVDSVYVQQNDIGESYPPPFSEGLLTEDGKFILTEDKMFLDTE